LSAAARQASEAGAPILLDSHNLDDLAVPHRALTVSQKIERLLRFVAARCQRPGSLTEIDDDLDCPVADCADAQELLQYVRYLEDKSLVQRAPACRNADGEDTVSYAPTIQGWQAVEPTLSVGGEPDRCFVAMWFSDELDPAYSGGFIPAIQECGFTPYRVKEDPTNKGIADRILSEVRRARFVVADFTGQRHSVYYEAGFAHGLGREVIQCCRADEVDNLTFDTRHLGHVVWKDTTDLRHKLADSIRANIIPKR
jgi:hypothetical protein